VDASPPVVTMAWVRDVLGDAALADPSSQFHPYTSRIEADVDYQVSQDALACEFGDAMDPESGIRSVRVCVLSVLMFPVCVQ
jgi:hypothetical protein